MMLNMREKTTRKLVSKDILDIDMDLSVEEGNDGYYVEVNQDYISDETFKTQTEAEDFLRSLSLARNTIESELRAYA